MDAIVTAQQPDSREHWRRRVFPRPAKPVVIRTLTPSRGHEPADPVSRGWALEVMAALDFLEPLPREAVRLVYFQRYTHDAAAVHLGLSDAAFNSHVAAGMQALAGAWLNSTAG